ncbi:hypothetical protein [Amycolatopsis albispora]|uniref:Lipoprotein n=1 Tax=Amycolatopsis albispora TaxID=1804986 RepID=A0A344LFN5_9PSEU|nr:hypothetical protein [Amycolatopsis albispora]AXB46859.1 hypothetical protein A4R43_34080 [Amycolatopsis albispora]
MSKRLLAAFAATTLLVTGCAQGKAGTPIPDGDEAAAYVSAKFSDTLDKLHEDFQAMKPRKSTLDKRFLLNGQGINSKIETVQAGKPVGELVRNHSNTDLNDYTDNLYPPGNTTKYSLLGPLYASLAPTPWVGLPSSATTGEFGACSTGTYIVACKMLNAVVKATKDDRAARSAKRIEDGSVIIEVDLTLRRFVEFKVEIFSDEIIGKFTEEMMNMPLTTRVELTPQQTMRRIDIKGEFAGKTRGGNDVKIEIQYNYAITEGATERDIPPIPDPSQVTMLPDEAAVADFNRRKDEIQGQ